MLKVPAHTTIDDLTVYADDTDFWRFYCLPSAPRVRVDAQGEPAVLLLCYALSDAERQAHPELPPTGGYLSLDTTFAATPRSLEAATQVLQAQVNAEWERLRHGTDADRARRGVAATQEPPRVEFGTPTWTEGAVKLDAPQSQHLVSARMASGTPSLLDGNNASFSLDLTPDGAQVMQDALTGPGDASVLQVSYDLAFWARLPPARIHMHVDSEKMHEYMRKQLEGRGVDHCTTYDYDHTDITEESVTLSGAVVVQIDNGSGSLPEEVIAELRGYAFDTLKQLVQSTFFQAAPKPAAPQIPQVPAYSDQIFQLKQLDKQKMTISLDLEQSSVVAWRIHPKATLTQVLGTDPEKLKRHVRKLRLDDPFFANLTVDVDVFANWPWLSHVEVQIKHAEPEALGTTFVFNGESHKTQTWSIGLFGKPYRYHRRWRAISLSGKPSDWSQWAEGSDRRLVISVPFSGFIKVDVAAGAIDFSTLVSTAQVTVAYEDPEHGVARDEKTVLLSPAGPTGLYELRLDDQQRARPKYQVRFNLHNGDVVSDGQWHEVNGSQIVINQPVESVLRVSLLPSGNGWTGLAQAMVDLHYESDGQVVDDTVALNRIDEFKTWQVFLKRRNARAYRYRWTASYTNGDLVTQDWTDNPGDQILPVKLQRPGLDIVVVPDAIDFDACPLAEVALEWAARDPDLAPKTTLLFRKREPQIWHLNNMDADRPVGLFWTATYFPVDRDPIHHDTRSESDPVIVLPAYRATTAGMLRVSVIGALVDWERTPVVGVDLSYADEPNDIHETISLTLNSLAPNTEWTVPIKDTRATGFKYRITYFGKQGQQHPQDLTDTTIPRVVIPAAAAI